MQTQPIKEITYGIYARKSSESEDKQIQSIERQIDDLEEIINREKLSIYNIPIEESKSAFVPGRGGFNQLIANTYAGKVNAWLCWHANRLSRNPVDAGTIVYLMDQGLLNHIRTPSRVYYNTPTDKMMLQIEFTMSKKDSDDKSVFVKSGLKKRYKKGFPTGRARVGYLNDKSKEKGDRGWLVDKERFEKVQLIFKRFLNGMDSISSITDYASNDLLLTVSPSKKWGSKVIQRSKVHYMLIDPIYAGFFYSLDEDGVNRTRRELCSSLPRIITEDEHFKILRILSGRTTPKTQTHDRPYLGFINGKEGNYIGVDAKYQVICDCKKKFAYRNKDYCPNCHCRIRDIKSPKYLEYIFYYNVKRRRAKGIKAKTLSESKIDTFLCEYVEKHINISNEVIEWGKKHLDKLRDAEFMENQTKVEAQAKNHRSIVEEKKQLRVMFRKGMITESEYQEDLQELESSRPSESEIIYVDSWYEKLNGIINLVGEASDIIKSGTIKEKKEMLKALGSNLVWDEENLSISNTFWLDAFILGRKDIVSKYPVFEPEKNVVNKGQNTTSKGLCPVWLPLWDDVRKNYYREQFRNSKGHDNFIIVFV